MTVYVTPEGGGTVGVNGARYKFPRSVPDNSTVLFKARAADGYKFIGWSGALSENENPTTHYVTCDMTVTTNFQEAPVADAGAVHAQTK